MKKTPLMLLLAKGSGGIIQLKLWPCLTEAGIMASKMAVCLGSTTDEIMGPSLEADAAT